MESIGYFLTSMIHGSLPWEGVKAETLEQQFTLVRGKESKTIRQLCEGLPKEFEMYFKHICSLDFNKPADYAYIRRLFRNFSHRSWLRVRLRFRLDNAKVLRASGKKHKMIREWQMHTSCSPLTVPNDVCKLRMDYAVRFAYPIYPTTTSRVSNAPPPLIYSLLAPISVWPCDSLLQVLPYILWLLNSRIRHNVRSQ